MIKVSHQTFAPVISLSDSSNFYGYRLFLEPCQFSRRDLHPALVTMTNFLRVY